MPLKEPELYDGGSQQDNRYYKYEPSVFRYKEIDSQNERKYANY
jgi:hypothetical protein